MKQFTPNTISLYFQCFKLIRSGHVCVCYLQMHTLKYTIKLIALHSFFRHTLTLLFLCDVSKPVSIEDSQSKVTSSLIER